MFFEISKIANEAYPNNHRVLDEVYFNCDLGWEKHSHGGHIIFYKGYLLDDIAQDEFFDNLIQDPTPKYRGNFLAIIVGDKITVTNDSCRGSPLQFTQHQKITNLDQDLTAIWADKYVTIDKALFVEQHQFTPYEAQYQDISFEDAVKKVDDIFCESFENFLSKNTRPLKLFLSGGIDTLTMYSYLKKFTSNFELIDYEYMKFTHFYTKNWHSKIRKFWGYTQMHSWGDVPAAILTGGCGDEYNLRGPYTLSKLTAYHGIDVIGLLADNKDCYHYTYFNKDKNKKHFQSQQEQWQSRDQVIDFVLNNLVNDHQHWHLDETICFTPNKDLRIPNTIMRMPKQDIINQVLNAEFNKQLIIKNNADDLKMLSRQKNHAGLENVLRIKNAL
jgi:hypothetical protein